MITIHSKLNNWKYGKEALPEWMVSHHNSVQTCPGLSKYYQSGIIIESPDLFVFEIINGKLYPWTKNCDKIYSHSFIQTGRNIENKSIRKIPTEVYVKSDGDYSAVIVPYDSLHEGDSNIVTGNQPLVSFYSPILINTVFPDGFYEIEKGQPLARVLFFKNETISINSGTEEKSDNEIISEYLDLVKNSKATSYFNKKMGTCPYKKDEE
jgi:hypothetical protein